MAAILTYNLRNACLSAVISGKVFYLPTYQEPSRVVPWEKNQELRTGKHTLRAHGRELSQPHAYQDESIPNQLPAQNLIYRSDRGSPRGLEVYDFPGRFAQKFDGDDKVSGLQHLHLGMTIYIGDQRGGVTIHGWPPCNLKRCVVVLQQWTEVWQAIAGEPELSFSIEY